MWDVVSHYGDKEDLQLGRTSADEEDLGLGGATGDEEKMEIGLDH